jgi:PAS domain S-box-containing protein
LAATNRWLVRTHLVIEALDETGAGLARMTSAERGYVATGDKSLLEPYDKALAEVGRAEQSLHQTGALDAAQQRRAERLKPLIYAKAEWTSKLVELRRSGQAEAAAHLIASGHGQGLLDDAESLADEMIGVERAALAQRQAEVEASTRRLLHVTVGGGVLSVLLVLAAWRLWLLGGRRRTELERLLQTYFDTSSDLFCVASADGYFVKVNAAWTKVLGWSEAELLARPYAALVHPEDRAATDATRVRLNSGAEIHDLINRYRCKDGSYRWLAWSSVRQPGGDLHHAMARDVTTEQQAAAELRAAKEAAESASHAKSAFLASMSHELRTPLNAILGFSQIMAQDADLSASNKNRLAIINRSGEHLLALINDVLEMAKIESGHDQVNRRAVDLHDLLSDLARLLEHQASARGLTLDVAWGDGVPPVVYTDPLKLRQILVNLLGNAIKYTEAGGVVLRVAALGPPSEQVRLRFEVADSGPGMSAETVARLFEPFTRGLEREAEGGGTGLGLAIAQRYVEVLGGELAVESTVGVGSKFHFELALEYAQGQSRATPAAEHRRIVGIEPGQASRKVLIVDDQESNRVLLAAVLEPLGLPLREARNGQQAIDLARDWRPDLILMDIRMPGVRGDVAAGVIRESVTPAPKIVAVTASAFDEERARVLAAGFDGFVRKPLRVEEVYAALAETLGLRFRYEDPSAPAPAPAALDPAAFASLPPDQREDLRLAALHGDLERLEELAAHLSLRDAGLAQALCDRLAEFDYDAILDALSAPGEET